MCLAGKKRGKKTAGAGARAEEAGAGARASEEAGAGARASEGAGARAEEAGAGARASEVACKVLPAEQKSLRVKQTRDDCVGVYMNVEEYLEFMGHPPDGKMWWLNLRVSNDQLRGMAYRNKGHRALITMSQKEYKEKWSHLASICMPHTGWQPAELLQ